ncbi:MAG: hypothetical protein CMJ78_12870 [Planctomycetaceae bacterium]|nr:hypothetical protein [Planctomycetaceae bacterium]
MSSNSSSPARAILTFVALVTIPTFAVFGIPQFVPMTNTAPEPSERTSPPFGQSDGHFEPARFSPNDGFRVGPNAHVTTVPTFDDDKISHHPTVTWTDPFSTELSSVDEGVETRTDSTATWQTIDQQLRGHGIEKYQINTTSEPGTFRFECLLPSRTDARLMRRFEATADDPFTAAKNVLAQIESWVKQQETE